MFCTVFHDYHIHWCILAYVEPTYLDRHPGVRDTLSFLVFIILVIAGTLLINTFIFRSFSVQGPSMETTMHTGDRLIVDRIPVTIANLKSESYVPKRGQIVVFKNPRYVEGVREEFLVKRVIAFPGERVKVVDGKLIVYNTDHPDGFQPDEAFTNGTPGSPTSGDSDTIVPDDSIYVVGDHREGQYSLDSRNQLGTVPYFDIVGPVSVRIWPVTKIATF